MDQNLFVSACCFRAYDFTLVKFDSYKIDIILRYMSIEEYHVITDDVIYAKLKFRINRLTISCKRGIFVEVGVSIDVFMH